jgi:hypothetical protein
LESLLIPNSWISRCSDARHKCGSGLKGRIDADEKEAESEEVEERQSSEIHLVGLVVRVGGIGRDRRSQELLLNVSGLLAISWVHHDNPKDRGSGIECGEVSERCS